MSQDPFQEREAEKYANPIPSREFILEHLTKRENLPAVMSWRQNCTLKAKSSLKACVAACARWSAMVNWSSLAVSAMRCRNASTW